MVLYSGKQTSAEWQRVRKVIETTAQRMVREGREFTTGTLVGDVRTKTFPEDPVPGAPTSIAFVANVRLTEFSGNPLARDVKVENQARQYVADGDGTPVLVKLDRTGKLQVVARAGTQTQTQTTVHVVLHDVDGVDLSFLFGLEYVDFGNLDAAVQTSINNYRTDQGLATFSPGDGLYKTPVVDYHGPHYAPGYIDADNGPRGGSGSVTTTTRKQQLVPWNDPRWKWGATPTGFSPGVSSWGLVEEVVTRIVVP